MSEETLAAGVLAIVKAATAPLHARIQAIEAQLAELKQSKSAGAAALRLRADDVRRRLEAERP